MSLKLTTYFHLTKKILLHKKLLLLWVNFAIVLSIANADSSDKTPAIGNADIKIKAIEFYDAGKCDQAISELKKLTSISKKDAFFCWLNIAIMEFERYHNDEARKALDIAWRINPSDKLYYSACKSIIGDDTVNINDQIVRNLNEKCDPIKRLLSWNIYYHLFLESGKDYANYFRILRRDTPGNSIRMAKILSKESTYYYIRDQREKRIICLLNSIKLFETLNYKRTLIYENNIKKLFYYNSYKTDKSFIEFFNRYEKDTFTPNRVDIKVAINYFKAKYFYYNNDLKQSLYYINKAYDLDSKDQNVIIYLAFILRQLKEYKVAGFYYDKMLNFPDYRLDAYFGAAECAFHSDNKKLCNYYSALLVKELKPNCSPELLYKILHLLYKTNQKEQFAKINFQKYIPQNSKNKYYAFLYDLKGTYLWNKNFFEEAAKHYHLAILSILPDENNRNIYADLNLNKTSDIESLISYLNNKGEAFYQLSKQRKTKAEEIRDLKACYKNLNLSLEQIYKYKMQLTTEEQKYMYSDLRSQKYPNIIKVCLELYNLTGDVYYQHQAFKFAEQGKASVMLSMMRSNSGSKIGLIPAKYKNLEDSLNMQITLVNEQLNDIKNEGDNKYNLNTKLDLLSSQRDKLEQLYRKEYPSYYKLKYSSEVVNPSELQASLKEDECIVEFQLNRNFLISYYIDRKNLLIHTDTLRTVNLANLAESFYNRINHFNTAHFKSDSIKVFVSEAQKLYNILLKPFELKFRDKKIIIVADHSLRKIPFEALLTGKPVDMSGYRRMPYLIRQNVIYYAPSVTFLSELRSRPVLKKRARLLAVAPVYSSLKLNDTISRMLLAVRSDTSLFGSLPNAKREIRFANTIAGGRYLAEKRATETRFKKLAANYDIIHLATHGILDSESSLQSNLLFADSSPTDDGFLHNYEIYNLQHTSQLVILSACNTGSGKNYGGEGVISTGRGFLSSGSRSVIMTLWPVNDHASYQLIKGFYSSLKEKASICDALRHSKLDYLDNADNMHSHPFFWTGYVIYGDASIQLRVNNLKNYYFIAVGILVMGIMIWMGRKLPLNPLKGTLKGVKARAKNQEAV